MSASIILDGPLGTELNARGVSTDLPLWSAAAITRAPEVIRQIHRDYADAGATVHTANTFRTKQRNCGDSWRDLTQLAVKLARESVPAEHRVAGSISPLEDCYRPDLSPANSRGEHREMAQCLAEARCDLLLCETFPHLGETMVAVEEAVRTGIETWVAFTAGPNANLMTSQTMAQGAKDAVHAGAQAVLVNCTPAVDSLRFVKALAEAALNVPIGVYANAGDVDDEIGWKPPTQPSAVRYAALARQWIDAGASIIGGCCGTGPAHIKALSSD